MALQAEEAIAEGIISLLLQQGHGEEFALGLGHFSRCRVQVMHMEPLRAPGMPQEGFRLCNLIGVVGEGIINAAAVQIQVFPIVLHGNAGALNVPAGVANTPGGIPLQCLILEFALGKPQHEVVPIALVGIFLHTFPHAYGQILFIVVVEDVVPLQLGGIKVHVAPCLIGEALFQQGCNDLDILVNAPRCRLHRVRLLNIQFPAVFKEGVRVILGNFHHRLVLPAGTLQHLILAGVGIAGQMSHIGNVHHPVHGVALIAEEFFQHILHDIAAQIADVRKMIHRRSAGVHFHMTGGMGHKRCLLMGG